ncbi:MAG: hypothetical protein KOO65_13815 [Desulfobacterales bacterium]|nr:hypothetical protein [Desulfobacterales bacterium]
MKEQNKQIIAMLQAFEQSEVLKAIELYTDGIKNNNKKIKEELKEGGWLPQKTKPPNREFYLLAGAYWVQSEEMRAKRIKEQIEAMRQNQKTKPVKKPTKYTGQKMDLSQADIKCPKCDAGMYKQSICNGCKEGKEGFKIRLICEENPDHEVLL